MREKTIEITIDKTGKVSFTVAGVKGDACLAETKFLEDALGGPVVERQATAEMYEQGDVDKDVVYNK